MAPQAGMIVLGLVGGVGCGKSLVARLFEELGAVILDGDRAGHQALAEEELACRITQRWGERVLDAKGKVDRSKVADIVFAPPPDGPRELAWLEQLTHPRIRMILEQELEEQRRRGAKAAVLDAAVLIKAGWDSFCDTIVFVDAPLELRVSRARARGWTGEEFARREAAQESLQTKRSRAELVIDNSGTVESTRAQVMNVWRTIASSA